MMILKLVIPSLFLALSAGASDKCDKLKAEKASDQEVLTCLRESIDSLVREQHKEQPKFALWMRESKLESERRDREWRPPPTEPAPSEPSEPEESGVCRLMRNQCSISRDVGRRDPNCRNYRKHCRD